MRQDPGGLSRSFFRAWVRTRRSRRWEDWTTTGCRGAAPPGSRSTTTSRGPRAGINSSSASVRAACGLTITISAPTTRRWLPTRRWRNSSTGWRPPQPRRFPVAASQPFNYLNVDLFAQDTVKLSSKLTWTLGVRTATNTNPMSPHGLIASLPGSFAAASHNPDQPLNQAIVTGRDKLFASTPLCNVAAPYGDCLAVRAEDGIAHRIRRVQRSAARQHRGFDRRQSAYINTYQGGLLGQAGGLAIAPGVPNSAVDATVAANQAFLNGFQRGLSLALPRPRTRRRVFRRSPSPPFPTVNCARPISCNGVWPSSGNSATPGVCALSTSAPRSEPALLNPGQRIPDGLRRLLQAHSRTARPRTPASRR
jgi:hypothetical protein